MVLFIVQNTLHQCVKLMTSVLISLLTLSALSISCILKNTSFGFSEAGLAVRLIVISPVIDLYLLVGVMTGTRAWLFPYALPVRELTNSLKSPAPSGTMNVIGRLCEKGLPTLKGAMVSASVKPISPSPS